MWYPILEASACHVAIVAAGVDAKVAGVRLRRQTYVTHLISRKPHVISGSNALAPTDVATLWWKV